MGSSARRNQQAASTKRPTVLVVEDEQDIAELLEYNLSRSGFDVRCTSSGEEALSIIRSTELDLILLDLMLPGMDGLELCRTVKFDPSFAAIPIVMVTARGEEADIVVGLELGADDYITKPFSPRVVVARVKAVLRRKQVSRAESRNDELVQIGDLVIDPVRYEVRVAGERVELTNTEFRLIHFMARRPGRVFTREQIVKGGLGEMVEVTSRTVDVHVVSLRRKLGAAGDCIMTVRGVGYRVETPERWADDESHGN